MASTRLPKAYTFCHSLTKTYVTATRIKGYRDRVARVPVWRQKPG